MKDSSAEIKKLFDSETIEKKQHSFRNISIWVDNYDDIFSDFDPRDFSERNISDDFLTEVKKVSRESDFHVEELRLLIPEKMRNSESENIIIKRLHAHFRRNYIFYDAQKRSQNRKGILFSIVGMILMLIASYISSLKSDNFFMHSLLIILEPAGWFLVWTGLDQLLYYSREKNTELDFLKKLSKSKIVFISI